MSIQQIVTLLGFCLKNTYFFFQGKFYEQVHGAAMGSPLSPLIANLFIEEFEVKALSSCPHPPSLWLRFVDDTFAITKAEHSKTLLQHINNQDPHIKFTVEEPSQQGTLVVLITIQPNNTFTTSQTITYTGIATTSSQPNKVYVTPWHTEPMWSHQTKKH